jgi:Family of unknown function (DUF6088)
MGKHSESTDTLVLQRIKVAAGGWVFTPADFTDVGSRDAVASALKRHKAAGRIRQLGRGLYDVPRTHKLLGLLWPSVESIVQALERKDGLRFAPSGIYAANLLGLSEQVPAKVVYLTDGAVRSIKVGPQVIRLQRTTPRNMATAGRLSGLVIQAFKSLGAVHITPTRIARLRQLPAAERAKLLDDIGLAPAWMRPHLQAIAKP